MLHLKLEHTSTLGFPFAPQHLPLIRSVSRFFECLAIKTLPAPTANLRATPTIRRTSIVRRFNALLLVWVSLALPACSDSTKPSSDESGKAQTEGGPAAGGLSKAAPSDEPRSFQSADGRFRARFPGEPTVGQRDASPEAGTTGTDTYALIRLPRTYIIECSHLAKPGDTQQEIQRSIAASQGSGEGLKVLESKDVTLKGRAGKDTLCSVDDGDRLCRERFFVDGKDLYHIISIVPNTEEDGRSAAAFVESFELLKD
jgi:hypothetical protein